MYSSVTVALDAHALLGEGALWDSATQRLLWVDIQGKAVGRFDPSSGRNELIALDTRPGTVVPTLSDRLMLAVQEGIVWLDTGTGRLSSTWAPPEHDPATTRFNDGKCDPEGRLIAGTVSLTGVPKAGALYSFSPDGSVRTLLTEISISNGIGWSADARSMYYVDTPTRQVVTFEYTRATGTLGHCHVAVEVPATFGHPDGLTIDEEGMIWLALWGGSAVTRWNPQTGKLLEQHRFPASQITSCAFGGPNLDTLFVTSAREGLSPAQLAQEPLAGAIFALQTNARGVPAARFGGH